MNNAIHEARPNLRTRVGLSLGAGAFLLAAACGQPQESDITSCQSNEATTVEADLGARTPEDPAVLARFANDTFVAWENTGLLSNDPVDEVGEIACFNRDDQAVLTANGLLVREAYIAQESLED